MENWNGTKLTDLLTEKQLQHVLDKMAPGCHLLSYDLKRASEGLSGFLGDHFKLTLNVNQRNIVKKIHLFVKSLPLVNKSKSEFIVEFNYSARENLLFQLFDEIPGDEGANPWRTKGIIRNDKIIVMPDLSVEGYKVRPVEETFDLNHILVAASSLARFHATFCNYITKRSLQASYNFLEEHKEVLSEPVFKDTPWLRAGARLTNNILKEFSLKWKEYPTDLIDRLIKLYMTACDTVNEYEDTVNVIVHKDLWANNIFFKYSGETPTNALLIDYQCVRYAPPAFDVMILLYFNTTEEFRDRHEAQILNHYYTIFSEELDDLTKIRIKNYNRTEFLTWCEKARLFAMVEVALIFPYTLMEPNAARKHFDDSEKHYEYLNNDRSYPVISHAKENNNYRDRQLHISEEIVEKYILKAEL